MVLTGVIFLLLLCSCSSSLIPLPTVRDYKVESFVAEEAAKILEVSENAHKAADYRFRLVTFPREDILGLSLGNHEIFLSYELSRRAYRQQGYRWLFRHVLAHEVAHDVLEHQSTKHEASLSSVPGGRSLITGRDLGLPGNISFRNFSRTFELAADRKAIEYWRKIGWNCQIWVDIFNGFRAQGYVGDADHPTQERLDLAMAMCYADPVPLQDDQKQSFLQP
jgi:predicted Zn-dependent protease